MMSYLYREEEIELIRHLLKDPPIRILWDFVSYIFDYESYYLELQCTEEIAATQNKSDEAIIAEFKRIDHAYAPINEIVLVCENKNIDKAFITRTFLYFTTYKKYSKSKRIIRKIQQKLKTLITRKEDPVGDLISSTLGGCQEIIYNPDSSQAKEVNSEYANLLDVGLLLEIDGKYLKAFIQNNGYGFDVWNDQYLFDSKEIEEENEFYKFIEIDKEQTAGNTR